MPATPTADTSAALLALYSQAKHPRATDMLVRKPKGKHKCASTFCKNLGHTRWITLTFRSDYHAIPAKTLFYRTVEWLYVRCWRIAKNRFSFVPELTEKGVLHYHLLITTTEHVRLAAFINIWKARYGNVDLAKVYCALYLKHHYMRKDNEAMAEVLSWPQYTIIMNGEQPLLFYKRLTKELYARNALVRHNKASKMMLNYIDKHYSVKTV